MARKTARLGRQTPTQALVLPYDETKGGEAVELYEQGGRTAMDWQKVLLYDMMAVDDDGLWVHSKFGLSVPRRNSKSEVDKMRELRGLFHGEHILHTAHRTTTKHSAWIFTNVPLAGDDLDVEGFQQRSLISIHIPLAGDDGPAVAEVDTCNNFYPHPPCGGRHARARSASGDWMHFYPHPPCEGRHRLAVLTGLRPGISIHVPLAGDDAIADTITAFNWIFLSTSPLRGTTGNSLVDVRFTVDFYPRPPCGGRPHSSCITVFPKPFLSTSPLRGTTTLRSWLRAAERNFYPRPPCGGRPGPQGVSDQGGGHFYPRPPCGGRQRLEMTGRRKEKFLSTSPLRGTTVRLLALVLSRLFLSTSPLRGTTCRSLRTWGTATFLSTSPLRGTTLSSRRW